MGAAISNSVIHGVFSAGLTLNTLLKEQVLSLTSSLLRKTDLRLTAKALGLPTAMGIKETWQVIKGHLISLNQEPGLVQVIPQERKRVALDLRLYLVDQTGVFAQANTAKVAPEHSEQ